MKMATSIIALLLAITVIGSVDTFAQLPIQNYVQTFNGTSGMGTGQALPAGWLITRSPNNYRYVTGYNNTSQTYYDVDYVVGSYPLPLGSNMYHNARSDNASVDLEYDPQNPNADRALGVRPRPNAYSQNVMVELYNNYNYDLTGMEVAYELEKYRNDVNATGTLVQMYYTFNGSPTSFSETNTDPTLGWVAVTNTAKLFNPDASNSNAVNGYPISKIPVSSIIDFGAYLLAPNASIYLAVVFSPGDPSNQGGNNAQNCQIWGLDNFGITKPLPVELTAFTANRLNGKVQLNWRTSTEKNNHGFFVERSYNRQTWENLGFVDGHGTVNTPQQYSFTDAPRADATVSYRLRQVDRDGKYEYSTVVSVAAQRGSFNLVRNFPNPFNPSTNITFSLQQAETISLSVFDAAGREVAVVYNAQLLDAGQHTVSFDATALPSGIYYAHLNTSAGITTARMVLEK